ncbi:SDR family oxidoreductase [Lysobacter arvi]|uniref:SDR family oxidoreductase n=1 Tax=Lysobacter arvi TaxID=3038776 RepID=A0ABU1CA49_9GAMM|nr:SDR family oxidoreductase [Lysobacter arvi]MDR0181995.1 SDR family oxidoreductase [Lysobacter arvi]
MKIVVAGGSGLVGTHLIKHLRTRGHDAVPASRRTGVNALTGEGLDDALRGAHAVIDVTNAPSFEAPDVGEFFARSTTNLLAAGERAGVAHYLALSVVGTPHLQNSAYFDAKQRQEALVAAASVPHTLVRATQFYEFMVNVIPPGSGTGPVHLPPARVQPASADDVAAELAALAGAAPSNDVVEIAGPETHRLCELVQWVMYAYLDDRAVIADPQTEYYGAVLDGRTLVPAGEALMTATRFGDWLQERVTGGREIPHVHHPDPLMRAHARA